MAVRKLNPIDWIALVLVIVGALNWGLVGALGFNLVAAIFGAFTALTRIVYVLVGLAGLYVIYTTIKMGQTQEAARPIRGEPRV